MPSAISTLLPYSSRSTSPGTIVPSDPTSVSSTSAAASSASSGLLSTGKSLTNTGAAGLQPVFDRLMKLLSGDPTAVGEATKPEVTSILRQYDTAKKNTAEFAPRGGGKTSALTAAGAQEASDIANTKSKAVSDASTQLGQLAATVTGQGVSASEAGTQGLMNLVQSALQGEQLSSEMWSSLGLGVGKLIASFFVPGAAKA